MDKANFEIQTPRLLDQVVQLIDGIDMRRDTKGDLYEYMLSRLHLQGPMQFRTPRHIIRMMVDMVKPQKDEKIIAMSGTSGFLVTASDYLDNTKVVYEEDSRITSTTRCFMA